MQSSKTLYLGIPHTGLARSWKLFRPQHAITDDTPGYDKLLASWSMCCWKSNPDVQGGLELSDLNSYSFPLKGRLASPLCSSLCVCSVAPPDWTQSLQRPQCAMFLFGACLTGTGFTALYPGPKKLQVQTVERREIYFSFTLLQFFFLCFLWGFLLLFVCLQKSHKKK